MSGLTVLVTGATEGVGYETARLMATGERTVIVHARTERRGEETLARLVSAGVDPARLRLAVADFTSLTEVATMAKLVADEHPRVDVLINNACTAGENLRVLTEDGHEATFQVNYLAHYLLTAMLEEQLSHRARIVNVSSTMHRGANLHWLDLGRSQRYSQSAAYAQSKLALTMFTSALPEFGPPGVTAVSVQPGSHVYCAEGRPLRECAAVMAGICTKDVVNGGYYNERLRETQPAPAVVDRRSVERLWRMSSELAGLGATM
ncbi:SDR family NAD(P)-dependent oxidoreductase [Actinocrispum sp. NPDC049592]|uniref:SDR family NAD(P)-dependent oxidoreductase n=1 Tax=Actinocrispum sp. NPDC049592 TaxID=3154835 RepID=UPI0034499319